MIEGNLCSEEWGAAKALVIQQHYPTGTTKDLWTMIHRYHRESFSNLIVLAKLALILPYQTTECERGFSSQNLIKTAHRSCLNAEHLNQLMTIKYEGGPLKEYDFNKAVALWRSKKKTKI